MKELICIVCPKGCRIQVDESKIAVISGYKCAKGLSYALEELQQPKRVLTSTVVLINGKIRRCPVKTDKAIGKERIFEAMQLLDSVIVQAPIKLGQIIVENILGTNCNWVATKTCEAVETESNIIS